MIDSPDIPLNVSRSYLQSDSNVKKISAHITKKVADKLAEMFKKDRKDFEEKWEDLQVFVQYGSLSEDKFADKAKSFSLVKNVDESIQQLKNTLRRFRPCRLIRTAKEFSCTRMIKKINILCEKG